MGVGSPRSRRSPVPKSSAPPPKPNSTLKSGDIAFAEAVPQDYYSCTGDRCRPQKLEIRFARETIAQRFSAGTTIVSPIMSPVGTKEGLIVFCRPCRDFACFDPKFPALKRWAIFKEVLDVRPLLPVVFRPVGSFALK